VRRTWSNRTAALVITAVGANDVAALVQRAAAASRHPPPPCVIASRGGRPVIAAVVVRVLDVGRVGNIGPPADTDISSRSGRAVDQTWT
jgi:hypothetical protein